MVSFAVVRQQENSPMVAVLYACSAGCHGKGAIYVRLLQMVCSELPGPSPTISCSPCAFLFPFQNTFEGAEWCLATWRLHFLHPAWQDGHCSRGKSSFLSPTRKWQNCRSVFCSVLKALSNLSFGLLVIEFCAVQVHTPSFLKSCICPPQLVVQTFGNAFLFLCVLNPPNAMGLHHPVLKYLLNSCTIQLTL